MRMGIRQEVGDVTVEEIRKRIGMFQWEISAKKIAQKLGRKRAR